MSGLDWFPTLVAAAGNPNITEELLKGKQLGDKTYQGASRRLRSDDLITGKGPSKRHESLVLRTDHSWRGSVDNYKYQFIDQPRDGSAQPLTPNMPRLTNLRHDPFERMNWPARALARVRSLTGTYFKHEMWRFQIPLQFIAEYAQTFVEYPPMQRVRAST